MTSDPPTTAPDPAAAVPDPAAILRSRNFVGLLVFAAVIGVIVSFAGWVFLEGVHQIQLGVFSDLPDALGYSTPPSWWYPVVVGLAGIPVAFAIRYLPGNGGHIPAHGLQVGGNEPAMLPGIVLAAIATLGLGVVLGPEAPLIAIGAALANALGQAREAGRAAAAAPHHGGGRQLRRDLGDLRLADRGGGARDRGKRSRRCDPAADPDPRADRRGRRLARVPRHGQLHRPQHERRTRSRRSSCRTSAT